MCANMSKNTYAGQRRPIASPAQSFVEPERRAGLQHVLWGPFASVKSLYSVTKLLQNKSGCTCRVKAGL